MRRRTFWRWFFLAASILTAVMIFCFSAQKGEDSAALSDGVTLEVAKIVRPDYLTLSAKEQRALLLSLGLWVRKCAHFCEFALLGLNVTLFLRLSYPAHSRFTSLLLGWGISMLYAGTDELHQMFVSDRGPAFLDVGIDSAGVLAGALCALLAMALKKSICRRRTQPL